MQEILLQRRLGSDRAPDRLTHEQYIVLFAHANCLLRYIRVLEGTGKRKSRSQYISVKLDEHWVEEHWPSIVNGKIAYLSFRLVPS
ncbi:MAG: hypothetical protein F6J93_30235 [Oscillatoria sp. SIO1A7]|nr:hypothetical protein [Oscillatoria sp. SIO1A7]